MNIVLFGATGMVGQGVLRACLADSAVNNVLAVTRKPLQNRNDKLHEIVLENLFNLNPQAANLTNLDACFYCLGISAMGMSEPDYARVTHDLTLDIAAKLAPLNPNMTFIFVSATGADSTGQSKQMWARVKGRTETALYDMPFKSIHAFRPGLIQPLHGIRSRTGWYNAVYAITGPIIPLLNRLSPNLATTTENIGHAMLNITKYGHNKPILNNNDINIAAFGGDVQANKANGALTPWTSH